MVKKLCTILILVTMLIPLLVKVLGVKNYDYVLNGAFEVAAKPEFKWREFLSSNYQNNEDTYLQQNVPFKGFLIALHNQLDYSLFRILHYTIEQGSDGQLFLKNHIDTHCGQPSISEDSLQGKISDCLYLKSVLDSMHIPFVFVLAPGKPGYMADKLPLKYKGNCSSDNEYRRVLKALNKAQMPVIDYNEWFSQNRDSFKYPAFPKLGIHWSYYSACHVMDSLAKYVAKTTGKEVPALSVKNIRVTNQPYKTDKDLWSLLNLLLPMHSDSLAYPEYDFSDSLRYYHKPKVVIIGDSYNWVLLDTKLPAHCFSPESRYWFYKRQLYQLDSKWISDNPSAEEARQVLNGADMVIFLSTEVLNFRLDFELANWMKANQPLSQAKTN